MTRAEALHAFRSDRACLCARQEPRRIVVGALSLLVCQRCKGYVIHLRRAVLR